MSTPSTPNPSKSLETNLNLLSSRSSSMLKSKVSGSREEEYPVELKVSYGRFHRYRDVIRPRENSPSPTGVPLGVSGRF